LTNDKAVSNQSAVNYFFKKISFDSPISALFNGPSVRWLGGAEKDLEKMLEKGRDKIKYYRK